MAVGPRLGSNPAQNALLNPIRHRRMSGRPYDVKEFLELFYVDKDRLNFSSRSTFFAAPMFSVLTPVFGPLYARRTL
jgi:hypothetical protein